MIPTPAKTVATTWAIAAAVCQSSCCISIAVDERCYCPDVPLERNILIRNRPRSRVRVFRLRRALVEVVAAADCRACTARAFFEVSAALAASAEQDQVAGHHFGHVFLLAAGLVVPRAGLQPAFDVDLATLLQIFPGDFGEDMPEDNVVP